MTDHVLSLPSSDKCLVERCSWQVLTDRKYLLEATGPGPAKSGNETEIRLFLVQQLEILGPVGSYFSNKVEGLHCQLYCFFFALFDFLKLRTVA